MSPERRDGQDPEHDDPVGELSYVAASRELDGIVEFFEKSEVDVDQLVARLERATAIVDELDKRIRHTRAQVEELVPKLEAVGQAAESEQAIPDDGSDGDRGDVVDDRSRGVRAEEGESEEETLPF
jgi:exodeoxyribonuclease VII small subunit